MTKSAFIKQLRKKRNNRISDMRRSLREARQQERADASDPKFGQKKQSIPYQNNRKPTHRRPNGKVVKSRSADTFDKH